MVTRNPAWPYDIDLIYQTDRNSGSTIHLCMHIIIRCRISIINSTRGSWLGVRERGEPSPHQAPWTNGRPLWRSYGCFHKLGVLLVGVLVIRALVLGRSILGAPRFLGAPISRPGRLSCRDLAANLALFGAVSGGLKGIQYGKTWIYPKARMYSSFLGSRS